MILAYHVLLGLFFSAVICATQTKEVKDFYFSDEHLEIIIQEALKQHYENGQLDENTSFGTLAVRAVSISTKKSFAFEYARFAEALYDYIDKNCLNAIRLNKNNALTQWARNQVGQKVWLGVHETKFIELSNGKYKIPERSIILMLNTIKLFNPKPDISWPLIRELGEFCISEKCQEIIYQSALEARNFPDTCIPSIIINRSISKTTKYDEFLKECNDFIKTAYDDLSEVTARELAITIINGPTSVTASTYLIGILKETQTVFHILASDQKHSKDLANFIVKTGIVNEVIPLISASTLPCMIKLKELIMKLSEAYVKISKIMSIDEDSLQYVFERDLFSFYSEIDPQLVQDCIKKLLDQISFMITFIQSPNTSRENKITFVKLILVMLSHSSLFKSRGEVLYDFEPFLDILMTPEIFQAKDFSVLPEHLGVILTPKFSKLGKSHLQKFLTILENINFRENINSFTNYSVFFLQARLSDEDIFWETLNTIYDFYQENLLEIDH